MSMREIKQWLASQNQNPTVINHKCGDNQICYRNGEWYIFTPHETLRPKELANCPFCGKLLWR
jgi:hypothetical protein